jgi:Icc-related predicted phosphoesterase
MTEKLKIVALSDLHGYLPDDIPQCDVVCIAGDICPLEIQNDIIRSVSWFLLDFKKWADNLPCDKVIFVGGNHDFFLYESGAKHYFNAVDAMKRLLGSHRNETKLIYLQDNSYEYKGKKFYGSPWIADLSRWAFYETDEELKKIWNMIPKCCDVLITHMPPKIGTCGTVLQSGCFNTIQDYGSQVLADIVKERDIKYHIFGHVHSGCHNETIFNNTKFVNVSIKDEQYRPFYHLYEFEI